MMKHLQGFLKLLDRYQKSAVTPDEKRAMDTWYGSIDHAGQQENTLAEEEAGKAMWSVISNGMSEEPEQVDRRHILSGSGRFYFNKFYFRLAAACFLFVAGFMLYRSAFRDVEIISGVRNEVIEKMLRVNNPESVQKQFTLSDGSRITLEPGAVLYYPAHFASNERSVFLKGNVFFEIAHDRSRPFYVHADNIVTRVLGTSFTVREDPKTKSIEVAVMTGVVEVQQAGDSDNLQPKKNKVVLTQNKKVTFFEQDEKLITGLVDEPQMIRNRPEKSGEERFDYAEMPFPAIISILEDAYGVKINIDERLRNCIITADLSQENTLFAQLEILCESIDARYEISKDTIVMSGKGCEPRK
ncbi:FecR family protein [Dyadobacter sp. LHD-138]|uniref:FecR family protein n=1 Tax=Dyadobacter sp. LHD-138 TaxID=3071413 RepID=UPI0027E0CF1E|nr:FecR family protein [Dyadobacter sp. LHD-138]MDQ6479382.1 FecR family protein [Dyadobacter sp. LHD-138]